MAKIVNISSIRAAIVHPQDPNQYFAIPFRFVGVPIEKKSTSATIRAERMAIPTAHVRQGLRSISWFRIWIVDKLLHPY